MDIRLIRANIALAEGDNLEVMRLIEEYRHSPTDSDSDESLILWLEANAQTDNNALIRYLEKLLKQTAPDDPYHVMAKDYLWQEDTYTDMITDVQRQARAVPGLSLPRIIGGSIALVASIMLIVFLIRLTDEPEAVVLPTAAANQPTDIPTPIPDNTQRLNLNDHLGRYESGLLMVGAMEDESARVLDAVSLERIEPVDGARFFALELHFECRQGICSEPPEALMTLLLEDGFTVPPRDDAIIQGQDVLSPIALGRRTTGWVVFEVPIVSQPRELIIAPNNLQRSNNPIVIELPSTDSP